MKNNINLCYFHINLSLIPVYTRIIKLQTVFFTQDFSYNPENNYWLSAEIFKILERVIPSHKVDVFGDNTRVITELHLALRHRDVPE